LLVYKEQRKIQLGSAFEAYRQVQNDGPNVPKQFKLMTNKKLNAIKSAKTLRKLGTLGVDKHMPINFEWPTKE